MRAQDATREEEGGGGGAGRGEAVQVDSKRSVSLKEDKNNSRVQGGRHCTPK